MPASIAKNHRKIALRGPQVGQLPPRRLRLGDRLEGAVEAVPRRRAGQLPARPAGGRPGSTTMPCHAARGPATTRCTHIGVRPTTSAERGEAPRLAAGVQINQPSTAADGEGEVGSVRQRQPAEQCRRRTGRRLATPGGHVRRAHGEHGAPQRQGEAAVPGHRRQPDRRQHVEDGEAADRPWRRRRPHGRARVNSARMMATCWSSPNVRSAASVLPNSPYQPTRTCSEPGP